MSKLSAQKPRLGDYFSQRTEPGREGLPTLSVTLRDGLVFRDDLDRKTDTSLEHHEHLLAREGDIAYNMMRMWQGASGRAATDGLVSPAYVVLRPTDKIDTRYAAHWFKSARMVYLFWAYSHGLTEDRLRLYYDDFAEIPAAPPPLPIQRGIAAILDEWDNAIVTAKKLVDTKLNRANKIRRAVFADIADDVVPLCDLADCATGVSAPQAKSAFSDSGPRFVRVNDLASFAGEKPDDPEYLAEEFVRNARMRLFPAGTVLFAKSGMSAKLDRVVQLPEAAYIVSHLGAVVARNQAYQQYVFHWLSENPPSSLLQGDGFPSLRISEIAELEIPDVGEEHAGLIGQALDQSFDSVRSERRRLSLLERQKRALMQELLSGDWPVPASIGRLLPGGQEIDEAVGGEVPHAEATG